MNTVPANPAAVPVLPPAALRGLPTGAAAAAGIVTVTAAVVALSAGRADWWPVVAATAVIAALNAIASVAVLGRAAGKTVDWLVTLTMAATLVRMAVSAIGLLVAVKLLKLPPEITALGVCGGYAAVLIVETTLMSRSTRAVAAQSVGDSHV